MRNLSCAVNVRRRGRSKSSGDAAAGAETIVGRRPSSLSAPAAARVLLSLMRGITTGCLSYALKGKLPAGLCLIIIGTEGSQALSALHDLGHCQPSVVVQDRLRYAAENVESCYMAVAEGFRRLGRIRLDEAAVRVRQIH